MLNRQFQHVAEAKEKHRDRQQQQADEGLLEAEREAV
jgi:hypothetical protein